MTNSLDLEHLRTLVAIAECGGFSKAAAVRHISQPALSQHVRLLERGMKRKLFEKDGRVMRFTPAGERVLVEARKIIDVHDTSLRLLQVDRADTIVVGSTEHAADQVLP
jgi:DNA-binding transcriptional LysR family regulator